MTISSIARDLVMPPRSDVKAQIIQPQRPGPGLHGSSITRYSQREAARHLEAYGGDKDGIDAVMNATRLISQTASSAAYHFERGTTRLENERGVDTPSYARIAPADLVKLLEQPNTWFDWVEMLELLIIDLLLVGNGYWLKFGLTSDGRPLALYRLHPAFVTIIPGSAENGHPGDLIWKYEYQVPGKSVPVRFDPSEVIHFRQPNPHSPGSMLGMGLIQGAARVYDVELGLTETMASYFENGAFLAGVIETDRNVPDPIFKKVERMFAYLFAGGPNAYKTAILERGMKYRAIQPSAADSQFEVLSRLSARRIYRMFGPGVQGILAAEEGEKLSEAERLFDTKTMRPLLDRIQRKLTTDLASKWGLKFKIDYQYVMPEEQRLSLAGDFATIPGVKVRQVLEKVGLPPTGDPEIDELVLNLPGENMDKNGEGVDGGPGLADEPLGSEPGRPPLRKNTAAIKPGASKQPGARARRSEKLVQNAKRAAVRKALMEGSIMDLADQLTPEEFRDGPGS